MFALEHLFTFVESACCFGLCLCFIFKFIIVHLFCPSLGTNHIYDQLLIDFFFLNILLRVFGTLVVHPFPNSINEYFSFTSLCLNVYMNLFITSMSLVWMCGSSTQ